MTIFFNLSSLSKRLMYKSNAATITRNNFQQVSNIILHISALHQLDETL